MRQADVSVHVDQRRLPCVLEPSLLLTHAQGPMLAMRLVAVFEPWLTRSFWQALDNSELLIGRTVANATATAQEINATALNRWITLRERTDESAWVLRWVGDRIAESQLRDVDDLSLFDQFELLQAKLETRAERHGLSMGSPWRGFDLHRAALDALSLSAVLEGALVLCSVVDGADPAPIVMARQLHIAETNADSADAGATLFPTERQFLREALARAGLAPMAQALPPLAALHVCLDQDFQSPDGRPLPDADLASHGEAPCDPPDPWQHARIWWYRL